MNTLLLSWQPGPKGSWTAPHPVSQGAGDPAYLILRVGPGYIAHYNGVCVGDLFATPEDAGWSASMHAFQHLRIAARHCPHARALLDAIAEASIQALDRSPLGGRKAVKA